MYAADVPFLEKWHRAMGFMDSVLTDAFTDAAQEYGLSDAAVPALVTLVMTFTIGMFNERLVGVEAGHAALLAWFEATIRTMEPAA